MTEETMPVQWKERLLEMAKADAAAETPAAATISLRSGILSYMGEPVKGNEMECIVLAQVHENRYYPEKWDPDNIQPPLCFALSTTGDDMAPHPEVTENQEDAEHPGCANCQWYQWESDPNGGRGKACKSVRKLAVIPGDPETIATADIAVLTIPVTSVRHWGTYVNKVAASFGAPVFTLVTKVFPKPDPNTQFKVYFEPVAPLEQDHYPAMMERREEAVAMLMRPYEKRTAQAEEPKPKKKRKY